MPPLLVVVIIGSLISLYKTTSNTPSVAGTTWSVNETGKKFIEYNFSPDGSVHYWSNRYWRNGTWKQEGERVYMDVNSGYAQYVGSMSESVMTVSAKNIEGKEWAWSMRKVEASCGSIGDSALKSYIGKNIDAMKANYSSKPLDVTWGEDRYYAWDSRSISTYADKPVCILTVQTNTQGEVIGSDIQGYPCSCAPFALESTQ